MIHVVVGLPGSGKTYLANKLKKTFGGIVLDDVLMWKQLEEQIDKYDNVWLTNPDFCCSGAREKLRILIKLLNILNDTSYYLKYTYFENAPEKAIKNLKYRNDMGDNRIVSSASIRDYWTKIYEIPKDVEPIKIWQKDE
jgi:hypothetical protein